MKSSVWIRDTLARVHWCLTVSAPSVCKDIRSFDDNDLHGLYTVIHHIKSAASNEFSAALVPPRLNLA